ncbi:MAG: hypothetical protein ABI564_09600 [Ideonella sp.]
MDSRFHAGDQQDAPENRSFLGRGDFLAAWRFALSYLAERGSKVVYFCDSDFADWPLGEIDTIDKLNHWAMSHRKLVVLAAQFETIQRQYPRWVSWRRTWSHVVQCRQVADADITAIPSVLLAPGLLSLQVHDRLNFRGRLAFTRPEEVRDWDELDAFLQRSHESFPVTNLGL